MMDEKTSQEDISYLKQIREERQDIADKEIFTSLMTRHKEQKLILNFDEWRIKSDRNGNHKQNICIKGRVIKIYYNSMDVFDRPHNITFIAPIKTFDKMLYNNDFDLERLKGDMILLFKVKSKKHYILLSLEEVEKDG